MNQTIICVDDERFILDSLKALLKREFGNNYNFEVADSGLAAIKLYNDLIIEGVEIPLVISDQIMPNMKGDELLEYFYNQDNHIHTIMLTGQAVITDVARAVNKANLFRYISKPWDDKDLTLSVQKALQSYSFLKEIEEKARVIIEKEKIIALKDQEIAELTEYLNSQNKNKLKNMGLQVD